MAVDEARRHALHEAAAHNRWTQEDAVTLMELLPPSGWADVARRSDLDALEHRIDLRFQLIDQRFDAMELRMDATIERALNRWIRWTVGTMIALTGVATAVATAIARLG